MNRTICRLLGLLLACTAVACSNGTAGLAPTYFQPARINVRDFFIDPEKPAPGAPTRVRFRLVRAGHDSAPIYWTTHLVERPTIGGTLSQMSGGPVASGETIEIVYAADAPTVAYLSIFPASVAGADTGDGTGDWLTMPITVK